MSSIDQSGRPHMARALRDVGSPRTRPGAVAHPEGPMVYRVDAPHPVTARLIAAAVFFTCIALLLLAARLEPDPHGWGTHQQLGFPNCTMVAVFGFPCPTCGMTTAFAHAVRGELISAFHAQPAGFALALATVLAACISLGVLVTGKVWTVNWHRVSPTRVTVLIVLLLLGGWVYKLATGTICGTLPVRW